MQIARPPSVFVIGSARYFFPFFFFVSAKKTRLRDTRGYAVAWRVAFVVRVCFRGSNLNLPEADPGVGRRKRGACGRCIAGAAVGTGLSTGRVTQRAAAAPRQGLGQGGGAPALACGLTRSARAAGRLHHPSLGGGLGQVGKGGVHRAPNCILLILPL